METIRKSTLFAVTEVADLTIALQRIELREIVVADVIVVVKKRSLHVLVKTELLGNLETNDRHAMNADRVTNDRHVKSVGLVTNGHYVKNVGLVTNGHYVKNVGLVTNGHHVKNVGLVTNGHHGKNVDRGKNGRHGKLLLEIDRIDQHAGQRRVIMTL